MSNTTEALKAAHDRLLQAVESTTTGDDWKRKLWIPPSVGPSSCDLGGEPQIHTG